MQSDINAELASIGAKVLRAALEGDDIDQKISEFKRDHNYLLSKRAQRLTENGYPADYMEIRFKCKECRDTGTTESGQRCGCFGERTEEAKEWQNSQRTKTSF